MAMDRRVRLVVSLRWHTCTVCTCSTQGHCASVRPSICPSVHPSAHSDILVVTMFARIPWDSIEHPSIMKRCEERGFRFLLACDFRWLSSLLSSGSQKSLTTTTLESPTLYPTIEYQEKQRQGASSTFTAIHRQSSCGRRRHCSRTARNITE